MTAVFPIRDQHIEIDHQRVVAGWVNSFGSLYEQRIVQELPIGPRADGTNNDGSGGDPTTTYVGRNLFTIRLPQLLYPTQPFGAGNPELDDSVHALWKFYRDLHYDSTNGKVKWDAFYFYLNSENNDFTTWQGDTTKSGNNTRSEPVTNKSGRYLVRFAEPNMSVKQFKFNLASCGLQLIEVNE